MTKKKVQKRAAPRDGRYLWDGGRLKEIREVRGLTQEALAKTSGVSKGDIGRHERNDVKSNPAIGAIGMLALALRVSLVTVLEPVGSPIPNPEEESGRGQAQGSKQGSPLLARVLEAVDAEMSAEDSWRGDVQKAVAVLTRALARRDHGTGSAPPADVGR